MSVPAGQKLNDDGYCFACGKNNPGGLAMRVDFLEGEARCGIVLDRRFQGWEGIAHGGIVSTLLDEIMAHAVLKYVGRGVTASMEVRYKRPVPVGKELFVVGKVLESDPRMVITQGEVRLAGEEKPLAQAKGKFILKAAPLEEKA